jgi:hypothetical protein
LVEVAADQPRPAAPATGWGGRLPIAGYQVSVDGVPADRVGGTTATVRLSRPGPHRLSVRAFNAHDRYSVPAEVSHP